MFSKTLVTVTATLSLFQATQAWNIELPSCLDPFKPYVDSGCYQNSNSLVYRSGQPIQGMTVGKCVSECKGNGFRYAGLAYYGQCYCGTTVNGPLIDSSKCNLPCDGNKAETCGGNNILSVYQDPTFNTDDVIKASNYVSLGCYTDAGSSSRSLSWPQKLDTATFTTEKCLAACKTAGYPFAGTEYGRECYCGSVLANSTAPAAASECNSPCLGNTADKCGGRSRMNIYVAKELESLEPCGYVPSVSSSVSSSDVTSATSSASSSAASSTLAIETTTSSGSSSDSNYPSASTDAAVTTSSSSSEVIASSSSSSSSSSEAATVSSSSSEAVTTSSSSSEAAATSSSSSSESTTAAATTSSSLSSSTAPAVPSTTSTTTSSAIAVPITTSTTTKVTSTSTTSAALCTATLTPPSTCEYKCGKWCAPSLPDFSEGETCLVAWKSCFKQIFSCWNQAGFPASLDCWKYSEWCSNIQSYCGSSACKGSGKLCNKASCLKQYKPENPAPLPAPTTSVYPCPPSTTVSSVASVTTTVPPPTNVCKQPSHSSYNFGPGKAVGGIDLPLVSCNDIKQDFFANPFKLYTKQDSRSCKSFPRPQCSNACAESCKAQYDDCVATYAESCKPAWGGWWRKRSEELVSSLERRTFWLGGFGNFFGGSSGKDSYSTATTKCWAQYQGCLDINRSINPGNRCSVFGSQ